MAIFRRMPYMVELFFLHPSGVLPTHCHPGVETQIMLLGGGSNYPVDKNSVFELAEEWGSLKKVIQGSEAYSVGDINTTNNGLAFLLFSKWPNPNAKTEKNPHTYGSDSELIPMISSAVHWHGNVIGEQHKKIISHHRRKSRIEKDSVIFDDSVQPSVNHGPIEVTETVKKITSSDYFKHLSVPESWNTLEDFAEWYIDSNLPLMIPWNSNVTVSDDACAATVFRKDRYQVELYYIYPHYKIVDHCHPGMEVITFYLGGGKMNKPGRRTFHNTSSSWGQIKKKLKSGEYHGGGKRNLADNLDGFLMFAIQKWPPGVEITSAAINWRGQTAGPKQEALIKQHHPKSLVLSGYADITAPAIN
jgi:quercetin dioxygenase-like cupin family protein